MNEHDRKPEPTDSSTAATSDLGTAPQSLINPDDLHDLISGSPHHDGNDEEDPLAELRKDPNYAALISELEYIAAQARLLFAPAEETPSDELWNKIQSQLPTKPEE